MDGRAINKLRYTPKNIINVSVKDSLPDKFILTKLRIKPFSKNAITILTITGKRTLPKKMIKIENTTNINAK